MLSLQSPGLAAHLGCGDARRIVDPDIALAQILHRDNNALPLIVLNPTGTQALLIDSGIHREQALHQLFLAHLQAKDGDRLLMLEGRIVSKTKREASVMDKHILRYNCLLYTS